MRTALPSSSLKPRGLDRSTTPRFPPNPSLCQDFSSALQLPTLSSNLVCPSLRALSGVLFFVVRSGRQGRHVYLQAVPNRFPTRRIHTGSIGFPSNFSEAKRRGKKSRIQDKTLLSRTTHAIFLFQFFELSFHK